MPSRTNSVKKPAGAVPVTVPTPAKRFELPVLDFNFTSLTDGTNIPPPLPSPIEEEPTLPTTPNGGAKKTDTKTGHLTANGSSDPASPKSNISKTSTGALKRAAEDDPASPTLSNRPGSIRRLFSRNLLNNAYANSEGGDAIRPPSRSAASVADSRKVKRTSGWFSRWTGGDSNKRASIAVVPSAENEKKDMGPPPPMIPELAALKSKLDTKDDAMFGSDLFKDIK
ncbi:hypothetical protein B0T18DRAFT_389020 [Schizothecium vesticola]|uniref:Uncharacterized protein n=1 Tax=Schizothecium vesticola TaxID=314040 RepID=A0AA40F1D6_9PEZI|nr:hypothetical protein B0T18DRAFT_389020 [Schizothecium vesticola]